MSFYLLSARKSIRLIEQSIAACARREVCLTDFEFFVDLLDDSLSQPNKPISVTPLSTAMGDKSASSSTTEIKNPGIIFSGRNYEEWRYRLVLALHKEGVGSIITNVEDEKNYVECEAATRAETHADYHNLQIRGQLIIADRLQDSVPSRIRTCVTVKQIIHKLDTEYRSTSAIGLINAKDDYTHLRYSIEGDLTKYLKIHESKAQDVIEAGEALSDRSRVYQLHASLPVDFDAVLDWYEDQDPERQTYERYRKKLLEKYERLQRSRGIPKPGSAKNTKAPDKRPSNDRRSSNSNGNWRSQQPNSNDQKSNKPKSDLTCYTCKGTGHTSRECPTRPPPSASTSSNSGDRKAEKNESGKSANTDGKPDWTKFRSNKRSDRPPPR